MNEDILGTYPCSDVFEHLPCSRNEDPFSGENIALAEEVLRRARTAGAKPFGLHIGPYPVPDVLNEYAATFSDRPYWEVEQLCGETFWYRYLHVLAVPILRSWVICELKHEADPVYTVTTLHDVRKLEAYLRTIVLRRGGVFHDKPTTARPVTLIQRPWVAQTPQWDSCAEEANVRALCTVLERMDVPRLFRQRVAQMPAQRTMAELRTIKSKKRQKSLEEKKIKWKR